MTTPFEDDPNGQDDPTGQDEHDDRHEDLDAAAAAWSAEPVLAALADAHELRPPRTAKEAVLGHARGNRRVGVAPMSPELVYATRVEALREVLDSLAANDWNAVAHPYDWTVHGLVAHLLAIEEYTAAQLGLLPPPDGDLSNHLDVGAELIARELGGDPSATAGRWSQRAELIVQHVLAPGFDLDQPLHLHGWPFRAATALIARAFELWTHADDIRRALGRPTVAPGDSELRTMSTVSVESLPAAVAVVAPATTLGPTRVVLTGPAGGTFDLVADPAAGGDGPPRTLIATDVVDYCRVVARRISPEMLVCDIEGDASAVTALLEAARILAV